MSVYGEIRLQVLRRSPGAPFSRKELYSNEHRGAIDQALTRLVKEGVVRKIGRALYVRDPKEAGDPTVLGFAIATAIAQLEDAKIQMSGAEAAHRLGLTADRPATWTYFTTGRTRRVTVGGQVVKLRHDTSSALLGAGTKAGMVISALRFLGENGVTNQVLIKLHRQLSPSTARQLRRYRAYVPLWMRECIDALTVTIR